MIDCTRFRFIAGLSVGMALGLVCILRCLGLFTSHPTPIIVPGTPLSRLSLSGMMGILTVFITVTFLRSENQIIPAIVSLQE